MAAEATKVRPASMTTDAMRFISFSPLAKQVDGTLNLASSHDRANAVFLAICSRVREAAGFHDDHRHSAWECEAKPFA
jgi:hypothetical protein